MHIILHRPTLSHFCTFIPLQCDENDVATEHEISSSATATPYRYFILTLTRLRFQCEAHVPLTIEHFFLLLLLLFFLYSFFSFLSFFSFSSFFSIFSFFSFSCFSPFAFYFSFFIIYSLFSLYSSRLLLYDKHAGGLGVCDELYCKRSQLLQRALELLTSCPCGAGSNVETHGCPSCLLDQRYLSYNMWV
jgi:Domain of unknown function (DUF1998)